MKSLLKVLATGLLLLAVGASSAESTSSSSSSVGAIIHSSAGLISMSDVTSSQRSSSMLSSGSNGTPSSTGDDLGGLNWESPVLSTDSWGQNTLSPICSSGGFALPINSTDKRRIDIAASSVTTTVLFFDCLSYLRIPYPATQACWNATKEILLLVDIISVNGSVIFTVPASDIYGGSVSALSWSLPESFVFSIYVKIPDNLDFPTGCSTELQLSFSSTFVAKSTPVVDQPGPRLLHATPFVLEKDNEATFSFAVSRNPVNAGLPDQFFLASVPRGCWVGPATTLDPSARAVTYDLPSYFDAYANSTTEMLARWTTTLTEHGHFFLCSIPAGFDTAKVSGVAAIELGYIEVFGGNPAFYAMLGGDQTIYLNQQYTIIFEGIALDLRPGHDEAKIVDATEYSGKPTPSCADDPGLGSEVGSDLGPGEDVGADVKIAHFNFTVVNSGRFFVCYRRYNNEWLRVYPLEYAAPHSRSYLTNLTNLDSYHVDDTFAPQRTDYTPTPTKAADSGSNGGFVTFTPDTPVSIPVAGSPSCTSDGQFTYAQDAQVGSYVTLHVLNKSDVNIEFLDALAYILCLPADVIYLTLPDYDTSTQTWTTDVELDCLVGNCDSDERLQYLAWLFKQGKNTDAASRLVAVGVVAGGGTDYDATATASAGDGTDGGASVLLGVLLVIVVLVLLLAIVFVIVTVYQKRKKASPVAATNRPVVRPAGTHHSFEYNHGQYQEGGEFDDVVAGIPMDNMAGTEGRPLPPRPGTEDQEGDQYPIHGGGAAPRQEYDIVFEDENNSALPAVESKEAAPVPVHPR